MGPVAYTNYSQNRYTDATSSCLYENISTANSNML